MHLAGTRGVVVREFALLPVVASSTTCCSWTGVEVHHPLLRGSAAGAACAGPPAAVQVPELGEITTFSELSKTQDLPRWNPWGSTTYLEGSQTRGRRV